MTRCHGLRFTILGVPHYRCGDTAEIRSGSIFDYATCPCCGGIVDARDSKTQIEHECTSLRQNQDRRLKVMKRLRNEIEVLRQTVESLRKEAERAHRSAARSVVAWEIFRADRTISPEGAERRAEQWLESEESK